jgi:alkylation response protein AidB-like acyl-CoA dehydrogenase
MDLTFTPVQLELQARARTFVREVLQPREVEFERSNGRVPRDWGNEIRRAAIAARLQGGSFSVELGGQGW